jgi:hypothetical protein
LGRGPRKWKSGNSGGNERQVLELREGVLCVDNTVCWWAQFEKKWKGQPHVKEPEDNAIASLDSYRRKWLNKKQRKKDERGCV